VISSDTRGMRTVAALATIVLLLTGCGTSEEPDEGGSEPPTTSASPTPEDIDLGAVCEVLGEAVTLPNSGVVEYTAVYNEPPGWATDAPVCDIEPEGEYYDIAAEAGEFGRAEFDYGAITEERAQERGYPEYTPGTAAELLTVDQAQPLRDEVPCANEPCEDGIHGHQYNFRFETVMEGLAVIAQFDYITTDVNGDLRPEHRGQAIASFIASADAVAAEIL
jgi:hypothetical protein